KNDPSTVCQCVRHIDLWEPGVSDGSFLQLAFHRWDDSTMGDIPGLPRGPYILMFGTGDLLGPTTNVRLAAIAADEFGMESPHTYYLGNDKLNPWQESPTVPRPDQLFDLTQEGGIGDFSIGYVDLGPEPSGAPRGLWLMLYDHAGNDEKKQDGNIYLRWSTSP